MCWVSTPPGYDYYEGQEDAEDEGEGQEEESDEPWLDTPERLRLILGLVAEFTEGSVSKVESEVSPLVYQSILLESGANLDSWGSCWSRQYNWKERKRSLERLSLMYDRSLQRVSCWC
jgi:hypothetical protein